MMRQSRDRISRHGDRTTLAVEAGKGTEKDGAYSDDENSTSREESDDKSEEQSLATMLATWTDTSGARRSRTGMK